MEKTQILSVIDNALEKIDVQNQITIARQEGFNQGYKTCLEEIKRLLEEEINAESVSTNDVKIEDIEENN